ncbi:MAG: YtxH domain-containing protein [Chlorobiales bacterium]|jgi:gas vesicle protein|nr:YtxH domain-containing protein [Chlorobiales bacterium]
MWTTTKTKGVAIGVLSFMAGVGIGLLLAPKTGKELRSDIKDAAKDALDAAKDAAKEAAVAAKEAAFAAKSVAKKMPHHPYNDIDLSTLSREEIESQLMK